MKTIGVIAVFILILVVLMPLHATMALDKTPDLAVDTSNSMMPYKLDIERVGNTLLKKFPSSKVFLFNSSVTVVSKPKHLKVTIVGNTDYEKLFSAVLGESNSVALILITDGLPNNEDSAIKGAEILQQKGVKICTVYIGSGPIPQVLRHISDSFVVSHSLDASLDACINDFHKKGIIADPYRDVDIESLSKQYKY